MYYRFIILLCYISSFALGLFQCSGPKDKNYINSIGINMIEIPAGEFLMGNPNPKPDCWDESPVHKVTINQSFYISKHEITIDQFKKFRPEFSGSKTDEPFITGLSWYDAVAFCKWLSKKEGKSYRLPTEAEWEYIARAGTDTPFWSGEKPPDAESVNPWGLANIHSGPKEWCYDWYGPYPEEEQIDPVGPDWGIARVIRGGGLDRPEESLYARSRNRASYGPSFAMMKGTKPVTEEEEMEFSKESALDGLIGIWYGSADFDNAKAVDHLTTLNVDWNDFQQPGDDRETMWSARWEGAIISPAEGIITFYVASDYGITLTIDDKIIVDWQGEDTEKSGNIRMKKGEKYPVRMTYIHNKGERSFFNIRWSWPGQVKTAISRSNLQHSVYQHRKMKKMAPRQYLPGHHSIGFRIVQGPMPGTKPYPQLKPFVQQCVIQDQTHVKKGSAPNKPWFRRRPLLPMPPDNVAQEQSIAAGLHPGIMPHLGSPALEVCPNGDVLISFFSAQLGPGGENRPEALLILSRLRYGADQWDMPEVFADFADANTVSPCMYIENNTLYFLFGNTFYDRHYPFQWMTSNDNGANWSKVHFPQVMNEVGPHTPQPISNVFRGKDGTLYVPTDGFGGTSVLWASDDNGETWYDTEGRTFGRHTTYVTLKDGRILGMGGKKTNIDGYMPRSISSDGGKTWQVSKTPFPELTTNQRPSMIRLQSGRLLMTGDFQHREGKHPQAIKQRGAYVALSEDEGETWLIKKLAGVTPHEHDNLYGTIGYPVARQAPNGIIHIISSMNDPNLHFELNEAWIFSEESAWEVIYKPKVSQIKEYIEFYPSGKLKASWSAGFSSEGQYLLHGEQDWYYEDGQEQWQVCYEAGRKIGEETYWDLEGNKIWSWQHNNDGTSIWTQYWSDNQKKSESSWVNFRAEGWARRWNREGSLITERRFWAGRAQ